MDFKLSKKYIEAMKFRDWQTCDLIADEHKELVKEIATLRVELKEAKEWERLAKNAQILADGQKLLRDRAEKEIEILNSNIDDMRKQRDLALDESMDYRDKMEKAREKIKILEIELEEEKKVVDFYATGNENDLEPKPEKIHLYDQDYPMWSEKWNQRSMSDYRMGKLARERQKNRANV